MVLKNLGIQLKSFLLVLVLIPAQLQCQGGPENTTAPYTYKRGDVFGSGKWYMGREIANVMGYQGMPWLERPERESEEKTATLLQNMEIQSSDTIADIGAGSGYHVFKMAQMAHKGLVYAVDIQEEMLDELRKRKERTGQQNITVVRGSEKSVNLPRNALDKVLMVDVYHEFAFPVEMMASVKATLKPGGKVYLIEYRGEDPSVPIKKVHKMTETQSVKEMQAAGFRLQTNISNLPWQHCMVFVLE